MAGPTPVSALIHAATMVTAGVYLIARLHVALRRSRRTALQRGRGDRRADGALRGDDRARADRHQEGARLLDRQPARLHVPRRSASAPSRPAIFHLVTHAFFKALLFLGAGSVIHGMSGEQDIRKMGGLRSKMPITFATVPDRHARDRRRARRSPGFFSKDEILWHAFAAARPSRCSGVIGARRARRSPPSTCSASSS